MEKEPLFPMLPGLQPEVWQSAAALALKYDHPAIYAGLLQSILEQHQTLYSADVQARIKYYRRAVQLHIALASPDRSAILTADDSLEEITATAGADSAIGAEDKQQVLLSLADIFKIIISLEHYLEVVRSPHADHWRELGYIGQSGAESSGAEVY